MVEDAKVLEVLSKNKRILKSIDRSLENGEFYDANQEITNIIQRFSTSRREEESIILCIFYSQKFSESKEYMMVSDLGLRMIDTLEKMEYSEIEKYRDDILKIFESCGESNNPGKYRFMNRAIKCSTCDDETSGFLEFHRAIANSYRRDKDFGLCQGHLIFCEDAEAMASLLTEWSALGYKSESPFFILRAILMLLSYNDVNTALKTLEILNLDYNAELSAPLQFAWMMAQACLHESYQLSILARNKYHLVVRRDPSFSPFLEEIDSSIFGVHTPRTGFSALLGNMR